MTVVDFHQGAQVPTISYLLTHDIYPRVESSEENTQQSSKM